MVPDRIIPYEFRIGVDSANGVHAYCLTRTINEKIEIILCKKMKDEAEFKKIVEVLSHQFGAIVYSEK